MKGFSIGLRVLGMTDHMQVFAQPLDDGVFERYLAGDCSAAERAAVDQWITTHRADAATVAAVRAHTARYLTARPTPDSAAAVVRLFERLGLHDVDVAVGTSRGRSRHGVITAPSMRMLPLRAGSRWTAPIRWGSAAAALCGVLLLAIILLGKPGRHPMSPAWAQTYTTTIGQRATITLSDGTRVTLAPASSLRLASGFGRETRDVSLEGDAYFDVVHTAGAPFIVRTGNVVTRVLGTGFDVSRYRGDRATRVAVTRGKVAITADHQPTVALTAGVVGFATDSVVLRTEQVDTTRYTAWRDGHLIFRDTPVSDAIQTIGRWYGVDVRLSDAGLRGARLNGTIDYTSVTDAVVELEVLLNAKATYERTPGARTVVTLRARSAEHGVERRSMPASLVKPTEVGR